jgi:hypothetical protein
MCVRCASHFVHRKRKCSAVSVPLRLNREELKKKGEAQKRKQDLQEEPEDEEDGGTKRTLAITGKEIEEQSRLLETDQVFCGVVFSQLRSERRQCQKVIVAIRASDAALVLAHVVTNCLRLDTVTFLVCYTWASSASSMCRSCSYLFAFAPY